MEYMAKEGKFYTRKQIESPFQFSEEINNKHIVMGDIQYSTIVQSNGNTSSRPMRFAYLGKYNSSEIIVDEDGPLDMVNKYEGNDVDELDKKDDNISFRFSLEKGSFNKSLMLTDVPTDDGLRIHCLGDVLEFYYHWISVEDLINIMKKCVDGRQPNVRNKNFVKYICPHSLFNENENITSFLSKSLNAYSSSEGSAISAIQNNVNNEFAHLSDEDREHIRRVFCIGCMKEAKKEVNKVSNYMLTVINCKDDKVYKWVANQMVLDEINDKYKKYGKDYDDMNQWLFDHDLIVSAKEADDNNVSVDIEAVPTKYNDLEGSVFALSSKFAILTSIIDQINYINKCNVDLNKFFNFNNSYHPVSVISVDESSVDFRELNKKNPFWTANIPQKENVKGSFDVFDPGFLEI